MTPQTDLFEFESDEGTQELTDAERDVWENIENGPHGPREYARKTNRSPGTIGNLLSRAWEKKGGKQR